MEGASIPQRRCALFAAPPSSLGHILARAQRQANSARRAANAAQIHRIRPLKLGGKPPGSRSGGLPERLVANFCHGLIQPRWLQVAVVPLVEIAYQSVGFSTEDTQDGFAGQAGCRVHDAFLLGGPRNCMTGGLKMFVGPVKPRGIQLQREPCGKFGRFRSNCLVLSVWV